MDSMLSYLPVIPCRFVIETESAKEVSWYLTKHANGCLAG